MNCKKIFDNRILDKNVDVSVIVPAFNAEPYIQQCVLSIYNQSLKSIEIIVVDDCSTDSTLDILASLSNSLTNVSIYQTTVASGSPAVGRNIGLREARGKYILFVDADDWLDNTYVELLYRSANESDADICFASGFKNHLDGKETIRYYKDCYVNSDTELKGFHESFMLWDKLFLKSFLIENNLTISELQASEELKFIIQCYYYCSKSVVCKNNYGYNYRRLNESSVTKSKRMVLYPSFEFDGWRSVDAWVAKNNIASSYQNVINLRKVLSFFYALSIINPVHKSRFLNEVMDYIPLSCKGDVLLLGRKLGYENTINDFFNMYPKSEFHTNNIIFGPNWSKSNPYQRLLADSLKKEYGVVSTGFSVGQFSEQYLKEKIKTCSVLHLHWLHAFYDVNDNDSIKSFVNKVQFAKDLGFRIIVTVHNLYPHDISLNELHIHKNVQSLVFERADYILAHDVNSKIAIIREFNIASDKVFVTNHGLYPIHAEVAEKDRELYRKELGISDNDFLISCVGRIRKYKGIGVAISQFLELKKEKLSCNPKLLIAGCPDDKDTHSLILQESASNPNILFFGREMAENELAKLLIASDVCLLPYIKGTTSGVAYLCLSYKVPMVTTKLDCFKYFSDEGFALNVEPESISSALKYLSSMGEVRKKFPGFDGENLLEYEWHNIVKQEPYCLIFDK